MKPDKPPLEAVLFDFDGVLLKSLEDHFDSWNRILAGYNVTLQWNEFAVTEGQSLYQIARQFCQDHKISDHAAAEIAARKNALYLSTARPILYKPVFPLLRHLKSENMPMAVVTGAHRDRFDATADGEMLSYFRAVVTADDVTRTKPDPEPFLMAASRLAVNPDRCLVVENAPLGIQAAKAAGMMCYAVMTTLTADFLAQADWIGADLDDFKRFLATRGARA